MRKQRRRDAAVRTTYNEAAAHYEPQLRERDEQLREKDETIGELRDAICEQGDELAYLRDELATAQRNGKEEIDLLAASSSKACNTLELWKQQRAVAPAHRRTGAPVCGNDAPCA